MIRRMSALRFSPAGRGGSRLCTRQAHAFEQRRSTTTMSRESNVLPRSTSTKIFQPGIQMQAWNSLLDSGFAAFSRAPE
jgi:hypothetical protein